MSLQGKTPFGRVLGVKGISIRESRNTRKDRRDMKNLPTRFSGTLVLGPRTSGDTGTVGRVVDHVPS